MKLYQIKILIIVIIIPSVAALFFFNSSLIGLVSMTGADTAAVYKAQCAACHGPKAEKFYNPAMPIEDQVEIILKGKKGEKPPYMVSFEAKGMTAGQAMELAAYMKQLRPQGNTNSQNGNPPLNANAPQNTNAAWNSNAKANAPPGPNSNANANLAVNGAANTGANVNANSGNNEKANREANTASNANTGPGLAPAPKALAEAAATYKAKCFPCHMAKVEKFFDAAKKDDQLLVSVLKGKKGAKPPFMPGYEAAGIKPEAAKTLIFYMRQLNASKK